MKTITEEFLKMRLKDIADHEFQVPKDMSDIEAVELVLTAFPSTDGELRDTLGYTILSHWLLEKKLLSPLQLKDLLYKAISNDMLFNGMGEQESDTVFLRTFSSLLIALILIRDHENSFLEVTDVKEVFDKVNRYCLEEKDFRGFVEGKGWAHAPAHISDVIDELVKHRYIETRQCIQLLTGIQSLLVPVRQVYVAEEDERMVTAILTMLEGGKITPRQLFEWLEGIVIELELQPKSMNQKINLKQFIRSLYFRLKNKELKIEAEKLLPFETKFNSFL